MKYLIPAILMILAASSVFAKQWRPFVGAGIREDIVIAQNHIKGYGDAVITPAYYPLGTQAVVGLTGHRVTGYVGYYMGHSPTIEPVPGEVDRWDTQQWTFGARWHPAGIQLRPLAPFVGGGITITSSRYDVTENGLFNETQYFPSRSRKDLGEMGEFGILWPLRDWVQISLVTQLHRYETEFNEGTHAFHDRHYVVLQPAFLLSLQLIGPQIL